MHTLIGSWIGRTVSVTLRTGGMAAAVTIEGKLVQVDEAGVLLELTQGLTFIPRDSILHVSLRREN